MRESGDDSNMNSSLAFYTSGNDESISEKGRFDSNGFLGIGTTGPTTNLEVHGTQGGELRLASSKTSIGGTDPLGS